jgi:predicted  nucleic acid-binding Zn-ribbon protein
MTIKELLRRHISGTFRTRSPERDMETDLAVLKGVGDAIDKALASLQAEQEGMSKRLQDASERASMAVGNESDEYLTREPAKLEGLRMYEQEMERASARLKSLESHISNLRFVRATFYSRFDALLDRTQRQIQART